MRYEAVVIGVSAGGIEALKVILSPLPASFPLPIAIVQHRNERSDGFLAEYLVSRVRSKPHFVGCSRDFQLSIKKQILRFAQDDNNARNQ